jgi:hypothetical protein
MFFTSFHDHYAFSKPIRLIGGKISLFGKLIFVKGQVVIDMDTGWFAKFPSASEAYSYLNTPYFYLYKAVVGIVLQVV